MKKRILSFVSKLSMTQFNSLEEFIIHIHTRNIAKTSQYTVQSVLSKAFVILSNFVREPQV